MTTISKKYFPDENAQIILNIIATIFRMKIIIGKDDCAHVYELERYLISLK